MIDVEKVIKGLECCANDKPFYHAHCDECPYNGRKLDNMGGCTKLYRDALELLEEQEPIKIVKQVEEHEWNVCGNCGNHMIHKWAYCPNCGKTVKWED